MSNIMLTPFQLLELNVISAQDLSQVARKMRTYAVAWVHPDRKLSTRVDVDGQTNPTWNDKFVFRVDDRFLYGDTSAIMIEIYAVHWLRDIHVGTVRVIVGNLVPPTRSYHHHHHHHHQVQVGMRFVALQVRRRSGRPQGILNIGVALLDSSMRSMPLYSQLSASAVGFHQLMGGGVDNNHNNKDDGDKNSDNPIYLVQPPKPELRRTRSDSSSMMASSLAVAAAKRKMKNAKASSMIDGVEVEEKSNQHGGRSKASSMLSGSEFVKKGIKFKPGSLVNGSELARELAMAKYGSEVMDSPPEKAPIKAKNINDGLDNGPPYKNSKHGTLKKLNYPTIPLISESDLGPSASEVAAAMAMNKRYNNKRVGETESEVMGGAWSLDMEGSMEGLQSKLDRWRAELPPVFDRSEPDHESEHPRGKKGAVGGSRRSRFRRHSLDGSGFSCFSNICGLECSIVCGGSPAAKKNNRRRVKRSPSSDYLSFL